MGNADTDIAMIDDFNSKNHLNIFYCCRALGYMKHSKHQMNNFKKNQIKKFSNCYSSLFQNIVPVINFLCNVQNTTIILLICNEERFMNHGSLYKDVYILHDITVLL